MAEVTHVQDSHSFPYAGKKFVFESVPYCGGRRVTILLAGGLASITAMLSFLTHLCKRHFTLQRSQVCTY